MTAKPDFDKAQNKATELLLLQQIDSLFVNVRTFVFDRNIVIDSIQHYAFTVNRPVSDFTCDEFNGCCVIPHPRCNVILYDENEQNDPRKHWGIAHELGHIYLEHEKDDEKEEKEAHFFAAQIVTPEIVLMELKKRKQSITTEDLLAHFNISSEAAGKRIQTLQRRGCYNCEEIDQKLLQQFMPAINKSLIPPPPVGPIRMWDSAPR